MWRETSFQMTLLDYCCTRASHVSADMIGSCGAMCVAAGKPLTKEQLLPEIGAFILAGFDTSSHTIAWCL